MALLGLVAAAPFNAPHADDFFYAAVAAKRGFPTSQWEWYLGWQGRYCSTALLSLYPQIAFFTVYKALPLLTLTALYSAVWALVRALWPSERDRSGPRMIAPLVCTALVLGSPSPREALFWGASTITYTWGTIWALLLFSVLFVSCRQGPAAHPKGGLPASLLCTAAAIGSNETLMVLLSTALLAGTVYAVRRRLPSRRLWLANLILAVVCSAIVLFAPGNRLRARDYPDRHHAARSIEQALVQGFASGIYWGTRPLCLAISVLIFASGTGYRRRESRGATQEAIGWALALSSVLFLGYFTAWWAQGHGPPARTENAVYAAFALTWYAAAFRAGMTMAHRTGSVPTAVTATAGCLVAILACSAGVRWGYEAWSKGPGYLRAVEERYACAQQATANGELDLVLLPLPHAPTLVFHGDLSADPTHFVNGHFAAWFGLRSVRTTPRLSDE